MLGIRAPRAIRDWRRFLLALVLVPGLMISRLEPTAAAPQAERSDVLAADAFVHETSVRSLINNAAFLPSARAGKASVPFAGTLVLAESRMNTAPASFGTEPILGRDARLFPAVRIAFFTHGGDLVPTSQDVIRYGSLPRGKSYWDLLVQPGRVWTEPDDDGWSRASFPFSLVQEMDGETHNGVAIFRYKAGRVSNVRFQIVHQTIPLHASGVLSAWGLITARYDATPIANLDARRAVYQKSLAAQVPIGTWDELTSKYPRVSGLRFDAVVKPEDVLVDGLSVNGTFYVHACNTTQGPLPYCERQRFGVWSITKSIANTTAMLRLAQKFGAEVFAEKLVDFIPEMSGYPGWGATTFGDALNMTTGFGPDNDVNPIDGAYARWLDARSVSQRLSIALESAKAFPWGPGQYVRYRDQDMFLLGVAMQRYLQRREGPQADIGFLLAKEVYEPIGIYYAPINRTVEPDGRPGQPIMAYGQYATIGDLAKIASLYRTGGRANGTQVLHEKKLSEIAPGTLLRGRSVGAGTFPAYLSGFWFHQFEGADGCRVIYPYMSGWGGSHVEIYPNGTIGIRIAWIKHGTDEPEEGPGGNTMDRAADAIKPLCP